MPVDSPNSLFVWHSVFLHSVNFSCESSDNTPFPDGNGNSWPFSGQKERKQGCLSASKPHSWAGSHSSNICPRWSILANCLGKGSVNWALVPQGGGFLLWVYSNDNKDNGTMTQISRSRSLHGLKSQKEPEVIEIVNLAQARFAFARRFRCARRQSHIVCNCQKKENKKFCLKSDLQFFFSFIWYLRIWFSNTWKGTQKLSTEQEFRPSWWN